MPSDLAAALQPRVERLGYLGEFFKCAAHQPAALRSFMQLTDDLKNALPDNLTEVVALSVAAATGNAYERHQHERLCRRLGLSDAWILDVLALRPNESRVLDTHERAVQILTLAAVERHGHGTSAELSEVTEALGPAAAMALLLLIGRYLTHSLIVNSLALEPPVASIFEQRKT